MLINMDNLEKIQELLEATDISYGDLIDYVVYNRNKYCFSSNTVSRKVKINENTSYTVTIEKD